LCELLALNFNIPVGTSIYLRRFFNRSIYNPHGWGLGFYPNGEAAAEIIKEPWKATRSRLAKFLQEYPIQSKIFIGHVRYATEGCIAFRNTHPFCREYKGRDYIFTHNGKLEMGNFLNTNFNPIGDTDSESAFCLIMNWLRTIPSEWTREKFILLKEKFQELNSYGHFNCIFSDGEYLFCYHDKTGYNGLCYFYSKECIENIELFDEECKIPIYDGKPISKDGYIIATHPLTDEKSWKSFNHGQLIVFCNGEMVFY